MIRRPAGSPVAYYKVAGVVVTGNEDGAHQVITEAGGLVDIGFTIPAQAWTSWIMEPGPGPSYTETVHKHDWSERTGKTMAANLVAVAATLKARPIPPAGRSAARRCSG